MSLDDVCICTHQRGSHVVDCIADSSCAMGRCQCTAFKEAHAGDRFRECLHGDLYRVLSVAVGRVVVWNEWSKEEQVLVGGDEWLWIGNERGDHARCALLQAEWSAGDDDEYCPCCRGREPNEFDKDASLFAMNPAGRGHQGCRLDAALYELGYRTQEERDAARGRIK